ncbi:TonB-dependent receptor plug domain-containing protein [Paracoccaceae bacterium GXU_MW_L88]
MRFTRTALLYPTSLTAALLASSAAVQAQDSVFMLDELYLEAVDPNFGAADRATTMYVSGLELEKARTGDMKDVFSGIASVSVGGGIPLTQKIFVNGVDMLNLGVTVDGTAQNNRAFHHVSANAIDPGLLKQVRADATISPADAGPYALAGSVVFETVDAEDILDEGDVFGGNFRLGYTDNGETAQGALTLAGQYNGFSWVGYGKRATGDEYENGDGETMDGSAADLNSYLGKLAYEAPNGHRFELSGQRLEDQELRQYRANFQDIRGIGLRFYDTTRESYSLRYENTQASGIWDPEVHIGYSESSVNIPDPSASEGLSETWSATVQNNFHLNGTDTITAGLDFQRRESNYKGFEEETGSIDLDESSDNFGAFAQARMSPTERLDASFGVRADRQEFTGIGGAEKTNTGVSGNASVKYQVANSFALRGGVSSVFGGIDLEDNYLYYRISDYSVLEASRANNATLGFDWEQGNLKLGGELFLTRINDARNEEANFDFESRGFNLGAEYGWDSGSARFTLSHSDIELNGDETNSYDAQDFGAPLGTVLAFEVEQATPMQGLRVGGGIEAALSYETEKSEITGVANDIPGYAIFNAFAEYTPASYEDVTLCLEVNNIFDNTYADRATYGAEYDSIATFDEPGRNITLTAVSRF